MAARNFSHIYYASSRLAFLLAAFLLSAGLPSARAKRHQSLMQHFRSHLRSDLSSGSIVKAGGPDSQVPSGMMHRLHEHSALIDIRHKKNVPLATFAASVPMGATWPYDGADMSRKSRHMNNSLPEGNRSEDVLAAPRNETLPMLMALGGGTGASMDMTGRIGLDRDHLRRMHYQDKGVLILVLMVYLVALWLSASLTYRHAANSSSVSFYADPRFHNLVMEGHDPDIFMEVFNQPPKNISLQVAGFLPVEQETIRSVRWQGDAYRVAFTFSLDLSEWVVREVQGAGNDDHSSQLRALHDGVLPVDRSKLQQCLTRDSNDLSYIELEKKVSWPDFEELATNIKHQIRQRGFTGVISVDRIDTDHMHIYKNRTWANFMYARATRILCALSIFGWLVYVPYMCLRCTRTSFRSQFRVDVSISDYWNLIADKLTADGFQDNPPTAANAGAARA